MYGGHIVNDFDRIMAMAYLDFYMKDELLDETEMFPYLDENETMSFKCPAPTQYDKYLAHIDEKWPGDTPLAFGLHPNAEIDVRTQQSELMFQIGDIGGAPWPPDCSRRNPKSVDALGW